MTTDANITQPPELPSNMKAGVYANYFSLSLGGNEAILDFGSQLPPPGGTAPSQPVIVARVITSKLGIEKLRELLNGVIESGATETSPKEKE